MSTSPGFASTPNAGTPGKLTNANTALDGTGTTLDILTAGASGTFIDRVRCMHLGSNVATAVRFYDNNGSSAAVAANNTLIHEITMPVNTLSQVAASIPQDASLFYPLKAGHHLLVSIGTAVAAGIQFTVIAGDL